MERYCVHNRELDTSGNVTCLECKIKMLEKELAELKAKNKNDVSFLQETIVLFNKIVDNYNDTESRERLGEMLTDWLYELKGGE